MYRSLKARVLASLALLSIAAPSSFADDRHQFEYGDHHDRHHDEHDIQERDRAAAEWNSNHANQVNHEQMHEAARIEQQNAMNNQWKWEQHNWEEQRAQLRSRWHHHDHMSAAQKQMLDAQLRAQWLQYHNNSWNGPYTWEQYSDPQFLNYLHNRNPSLLTQIWSSLGI